MRRYDFGNFSGNGKTTKLIKSSILFLDIFMIFFFTFELFSKSVLTNAEDLINLKVAVICCVKEAEKDILTEINSKTVKILSFA